MENEFDITPPGASDEPSTRNLPARRVDGPTDWSAPIAADISGEDLLERMAEAYLAGYHSEQAIAGHLLGDRHGAEYELLVARVRRHLESSREFRQVLHRIRSDMVGGVIHSYRREVFKYKGEMDRLASECRDPRVRFQANKDALDRAGAAPVQKHMIFTPKDYADMLHKYQEDSVEGEVE